MGNQVINQSLAELFNEILSTPNHPQQDILRKNIKDEAYKMTRMSRSSEGFSDAKWLEAIRIKNMCDVLFFKGTISDKQVAWMTRYAIKNNVQL